LESKNATDRHLKNGGDLDCNKCIVYRHIRLDKNEPFYIGIGNNIKRAYNKTRRSNMWKSIIAKTDYEVEILFENVSWDFAKEKEKEFIKLYGRRDLNTGTLVNFTNGGEGVVGLIFSKEARDKISKANSGKNNAFYGKKHSKKVLKKLSEQKLGGRLSEQHKKNIGNGVRGYKNGNAKKVLHIPTNKKYGSLREACTELNLNYGSIRTYINKYPHLNQFKYI